LDDRDGTPFVVAQILDNGYIIIKDTKSPKRHAIRGNGFSTYSSTRKRQHIILKNSRERLTMWTAHRYETGKVFTDLQLRCMVRSPGAYGVRFDYLAETIAKRHALQEARLDAMVELELSGASNEERQQFSGTSAKALADQWQRD
jgi:hypothetical protein